MNSQTIKGTIFFDDDYDNFGIPGVQVKLERTGKEVLTDFDGVFVLPVDSNIKKDNLLITCYDLTVEIIDIELDDKLDIGNFYIPIFKSISVEEYKLLTESRKQNCEPTYHWAQLLGYVDKSRLENDILTFNCNKKIDKYIFDSKNKTVKIDWSIIKNCI